MSNHVRVNATYRFEPVLIDICSPAHNTSLVKQGDIVRVINLHGAPKANTMGHCYIQTLAGELIDMVCTNSLVRK